MCIYFSVERGLVFGRKAAATILYHWDTKGNNQRGHGKGPVVSRKYLLGIILQP